MKLAILFCVLFISIGLSSCCTHMDCVCPTLSVEIQVSGNFSGYSLIRTTKAYDRIDSCEMIFYYPFNGTYHEYNLDKSSFNFGDDQSIEDFNYLIKSSGKKKLDTLSNITFKPERYSFECNDCFLKKDIRYCDNITETKLDFNGHSFQAFKVAIE